MDRHQAAVLDRSSVQQRANVYVELTKPRITAMVLLTVAIGFALAPATGAPAWSLLHVLIGAGLSCSGAGALNQLMERNLDSAMARTRFRPLPTHKISPAAAMALGSLLALGGVGYLLVTTNALTASLNAATLASYLFIYTPMKRSTSLSTLVGAVPGALPPVMGWAAADNRIGLGAVALFVVLFLWQIPHFLAIGRMYRDDYESGGFPMLVVVDQSGQVTGRQMVLYAAALLPVSLSLCPLGLAGEAYFWTALTAGLAYLGASLWAAVQNDTASARRLLLTSVLYLPVLFGGLLLDRVFA
jgi:protoheme IX farnesyltransferase